VLGVDVTLYTHEKGEEEAVTMLNKTADRKTAVSGAKSSYSLNQNKTLLKIGCDCYPGLYSVVACPVLIPRPGEKFEPAIS